MADKILQHKTKNPLHEIPFTASKKELHKGLDTILDSDSHHAKDIADHILNSLWDIKVRR